MIGKEIREAFFEFGEIPYDFITDVIKSNILQVFKNKCSVIRRKISVVTRNTFLYNFNYV